MTGNQDISLWLALSRIRGLGDESFRRLLREFGAPRQIFAASCASLERVVRPPIARAIAAGPDFEGLGPTLEWLSHPRNSILTLEDPAYPQALLQTADPPTLLYAIGRVELLNRLSLAIVGSRNPTPQGAATARNFGRFLSDAGWCVVSGLALGIDGAAHQGGLQGSGSSVAVVGTGLDIVYPARHRALAHELAEHGALVSEFPLGTPSRAQNFPRRNRIISGLAKGCLVVEAALRSGSLITARLAAEQGREVFAVPGSIHSPLAKGCHYLIKQGAKLVENGQDILDELGYHAVPEPAPAVPFLSDDDEGRVLHCLGFDPVGIDALVACSGLTSDRLCAILLLMELAGRVTKLDGGLYQRFEGT